MTTTERLRKQLRDVLALGVSQKTLAGVADVSESTFSRWYRRAPDSKGRSATLPIEAIDAFEAYIQRFADLTSTQGDTPRAQHDRAAAEPFRTDDAAAERARPRVHPRRPPTKHRTRKRAS